MDQSIQDRVIKILTGMRIDLSAGMIRTILLRDGCLVGEKYRHDGGCAIWLARENVVEVYDSAGQLVKAIAVGIGENGRAA
jgi:hypothetical protein